MIGLLKSKLKKILIIIVTREIKRKVTLKGEKYNFQRCSRILLKDGSTKDSIILGNNVTMYGRLESQAGGNITIGDYVLIKIVAL